jgi:hypothetical protein
MRALQTGLVRQGVHDVGRRLRSAAQIPRPTPMSGLRPWQFATPRQELKNTALGHPAGPFSRDNPTAAAIYDWFVNGTGNNSEGEGHGLACE